MWPWWQSYTQLQPSGERRSSTLIPATASSSRSRATVVASQRGCWRLTAGRHDVAFVPRVDALLGVRQPHARCTVDVDGPGTFIHPVGQVADVVAQRPAGRHVGRIPGRRRDAPHDRVEAVVEETGVMPEARVIRGTRVRHERIAIDLAVDEVVGPGLDHGEMVEIVAVQRRSTPSPKRRRS